MATLEPGWKESDDFNFGLLDLGFMASDPAERQDALSQILLRRGICLDASRFEDRETLVQILLTSKTCGDVICGIEAVTLRPADARDEAQQNIWKSDMKAAERAWETEYVVSEAILDYIANKLESYASQWDKHDTYAPLVALVQSSGWGKSRLMCQLWRRNFFVFYLSCMPEKQTGFPRRTEKLADIMQSPKSTMATYVALVLSIITVLNKHAADMTSKEWIQSQEKTSSIQEEVLAVYEKNLQEIAHYDKLDQSSAEAKFELCFKKEIDRLKEHQVKLLLCVDEAGELGENFVKFRRSLRSIPRGGSFFSVVLGTDRKVADLEAAPEDDPSARVRLARPYKVFHPLYLIGKTDIFAKATADIGSEAETSTVAEHVIRFGRPLWAAYYDSVDEASKLRATIQFAKMKLLGKNIDTSQPGWVTQNIAVAVFSCIVGVDVVAWGSLPQELVARHMRTIIDISKDRRRVYTAAAAEPVLAAAAAELLHTQEDAFLGDFLTRLIEVFQDGLVLEGVRGEVVARIIIMLAMHECTKGDDYIKPVTLGTFLKTMVGESNVEKLAKNCCDLDGYNLFFNSFAPISVEISKELADGAFDRCIALTAQRNESVVDFAIPCRSTTKFWNSDRRRPMQATVKAELENQEIPPTSVPVQVKNRRTSDPMTEPRKQLKDENRMNAPVQLFFQIGHTGESKIEIDHEAVVAFGMDCFKHLTSQRMRHHKVLEKLKLLSRTCENVYKNVSSDEREIMKDMIPIGLASKVFRDHMNVEDELQIPMKYLGKRGRQCEDVQMREAEAKEDRAEDAMQER